MNNAVRHTLGFFAGLVALPGVLLPLCYGSVQITRDYQALAKPSATGIAAVLGAGLILGVLCGSRVSPLGSLVPGAVFLLYGVAWSVDPYAMSGSVVDPLPDELRRGLLELTSLGVVLVLGVLLVVASVPPSRWRVLPKPPPVPYPRLPFATPLPGSPPADGPQPPPLPYRPGT